MQWTRLQEDAWDVLWAWSRGAAPKKSTARALFLWGRSGSGKSALVQRLAHETRRRLIVYYDQASDEDIRGWKNSNAPLLWTCDVDELCTKSMSSILRSISMWSQCKPAWVIFQSCRRPPEDMPEAWASHRLLERDMRPRDGAMDPVIHEDRDWHACVESVGIGRMDDEFDYVPKVPFPETEEWFLATWDDASVANVLSTRHQDPRLAAMASAALYHYHLSVHKSI